MLKSDLIKPRIESKGGQIAPRLLPADYRWLGVAEELIALFARFQGQSRAALDDALRDFEGDRIDYPILRGLADVLAGRAAFDNQPPMDPAELRAALFARGPALATKKVTQGNGRSRLLKEIAATYQLTPAQVESALFADLADEQVMIDSGEPITPAQLIARYNLEVARGLLYWAREMHIHVEDGYRDLFRYIKLMGLMYTITPAESGYDVTLHGPISPFVKSTIRYGLQFARFMPALLLCQRWQMQALVRPPGFDRFMRYRLDDQTTLRTHFKASPLFASKLEANFAAEFEAKYTRTERVWELGYEDELILVGDAVMIPDFSFTHRQNGRRALLEIVGFWHPDYLRRKLKKIRQAGREDLIVLVYESANVAADSFETAAAGEVLAFTRKPILKDVLAAVERSAV